MRAMSSKLDGFAHFRHLRRQSMALLDQSGQRSALIVFTVSQYHTRSARCDDIEPMQQIRLACVRAKPAQGVNGCLHGDFLSEHFHLLLTIDELSPE
jgi:hypothetical protein